MKKIGKLFGILLGNLIFAFGVSVFTIPNHFLVGGTTGIAQSMEHYFQIEVSVTVGIVNVAAFALGLYFLGKRFALTTLISTLIYPVFLQMFLNAQALQGLTSDRLLSAIVGGVINGAGLGLVLRLGGSTGGMDIPPLILHQKFRIPIAVGMYFFDIIILLAQAMFSDTEEILYGLVSLLLTSLVLNQFLVSGAGGMQVLIISKEYLIINKLIQEKLDLGSTFLNIQTGHDKIEQKAVLCVLPNRDLNRLDQIVQEVDPKAFMIINSAREVKGRGFTLDKHLPS